MKLKIFFLALLAAAPLASAQRVFGTGTPTPDPSATPAVSPAVSPAASRTVSPTPSPTASPAFSPTASPQVSPTASPVLSPTPRPEPSVPDPVRQKGTQGTRQPGAPQPATGQ